VVLNGSGEDGAAARAADGLRGYGLRVVETGNAPRPTGEASTLSYPRLLEQQARLLSFLLGKQVKLVPAAAGQSGGSRALILTVGTSYQGVAPPG
jgi:LytR cell envelope-related transcriptional attenuator